MPRYFFHLFEGGEVILDEEGSRLDSLSLAQERGLAAFAELAAEAL